MLTSLERSALSGRFQLLESKTEALLHQRLPHDAPALTGTKLQGGAQQGEEGGGGLKGENAVHMTKPWT